MIYIEMTFKVTLILVVISYSQCLHEICKLPIETGPCENWQYRWAYNVLSDQCEKFKFSGCEGNQNNFHSSQQCQAVCRKLNSVIPLKLQRTKNSCEQPIDPGNCYASIPRYYYNTETGNCEQFVYGGCGGNGNNFLTEDECVKKCKSPQGDENELGEGDTARETEDQIEDDDENKKVGYRALKVDPMRKICSLVAETGPCNRRIRRYFYNGLTKKCTQFYYGGCDGNKNNFMSLNECRKACFKSMETYSLKKGYSLAVCRLLPESGPCNEYVTKYYFNTITEQCDTFEYGGCRGNKNRFDTIEDCRITCKAMGNKLDELTSINACKDEPLYQYDVIADCYKFSIVYSYNETSNSCKKFYYSGCGGNRNRFRNKQLCVDTCVRKDIE